MIRWALIDEGAGFADVVLIDGAATEREDGDDAIGLEDGMVDGDIIGDGLTVCE